MFNSLFSVNIGSGNGLLLDGTSHQAITWTKADFSSMGSVAFAISQEIFMTRKKSLIFSKSLPYLPGA